MKFWMKGDHWLYLKDNAIKVSHHLALFLSFTLYLFLFSDVTFSYGTFNSFINIIYHWKAWNFCFMKIERKFICHSSFLFSQFWHKSEYLAEILWIKMSVSEVPNYMTDSCLLYTNTDWTQPIKYCIKLKSIP